MSLCNFRLLLFILTGLLLAADLADASHYFHNRVRARIQQQIETEINAEGFACQGEPICGVQLIPGIYRERRYMPLWLDHDGLRQSAHTLATAIHNASRQGLRPTDYHIETIDRIIAQLTHAHHSPDTQLEAVWADLDLLLTDAFLLLAAHLSGGRINPETLHPDWVISTRAVDLLGILETVIQNATIEDALTNLQPSHDGYNGLRGALAAYRQIEKEGGWPAFVHGSTLRPFDRHPKVVDLRGRLRASGDLPHHVEAPDRRHFDSALVDAVKAFQARHGLDADGAVGPKTRAALNVPVEKRIRQIELNLERWRWLPGDLGKRYIAVNTASFVLSVVEDGATLFNMPVVVGRPARQTPVFSAKMTYLVLNPYWNVPYSIAVKDILPKLAEGADYLIEKGFKVFSDWSADAVEVDPHQIDWTAYGKSHFPFRLRQEPGQKNALGQIKFMFPNKFAVYLHDSPQRSLFQRIQRGFSSGCIRVSNAPLLAAYLLSDDAIWRPEQLLADLTTGQRKVIRIPEPMPVHLLYMTAWVDHKGTMHFRQDIYERDRALNDALMKRNPYRPLGRS